MKANRKFVEGEDAVSAVIGVILMVAITVAIAATVYVYVTGMIQTGTTETENASVTAKATDDDLLRVTLASGGQRYTDGYAAADIGVFVDGTAVVVTGIGTWIVGEGILIDNGAVATTTVTGYAADQYAVTVTILDTVVFDSEVRVV